MSKLHLGDCVDVMRELDEASVDAIVTDPPYGLGFMGKEWDSPGGTGDFPMRRTDAANTVNTGVTRQSGRQRSCSDFVRRQLRDARSFQAWCEEWSSEALRVLKPGGHAVVFGGTRTYHRLAAGLEDAGFEIRDCLTWLYGSGFPKSRDIAKDIDARAGHPRSLAGPVVSENGAMSGPNYERTDKGEPVTAAAAAGWGTALKPAHEPILLVRKAPIGTVAENYTKHGTGGLNVDACRIGFASDADKAAAAAAAAAATQRLTRDQNENRIAYGRFENGPASLEPYLANMDKGRWPANVLLDDTSAALLDEQAGVSVSRSGVPGRSGKPGEGWGIGTSVGTEYDDAGGASRFFYVAKTSTAERNAGLQNLDEVRLMPDLPDAAWVSGRNPYLHGGSVPRKNFHPTVKPVDLMRWLCRLVTPQDGIILDPFLGSGTTGIAAGLEGFGFIGIEREREYLELAEARMVFWTKHGEKALEIVRTREAADRVREQLALVGQFSLFEAIT